MNIAHEYPRLLGWLYQCAARWRWIDFHNDIEPGAVESTGAQEAYLVTRQRAISNARLDANTDLLLALARIERLQWTK